VIGAYVGIAGRYLPHLAAAIHRLFNMRCIGSTLTAWGFDSAIRPSVAERLAARPNEAFFESVDVKQPNSQILLKRSQL
jgi:hypothetical protein